MATSQLACWYCESENTSARCTGCSTARYCSRECQKKDWSLHKLNCLALKESARWTSVKSKYKESESCDGQEEEEAGTGLCWHCRSEAKLLRCSGCKIAHYCGRTCQKMSWAESHKNQCEEWKELLEDPPNAVLKKAKQEFTERNPWLFVRTASHLRELEVAKYEDWDDRTFCGSAEKKRAIHAWFKTAKLGDFLPSELHHQRDTLQKTVVDLVRYEYSNAAPVPLLSTHHLAVGFVDLGILAYAQAGVLEGFDSSLSELYLADVLDNRKDIDINFTGFDGTGMHVAKSLVMWEMAKGLEAEDSHMLAEVWYSFCWTTETLEAFRSACERVLANGSAERSSCPSGKFHNMAAQLSVVNIVEHYLDICDNPPSYLSVMSSHASAQIPVSSMAFGLKRAKDRTIAKFFITNMVLFDKEIEDPEDLVGSVTFGAMVRGGSLPNPQGKSLLGALPILRLIREWKNSEEEILSVAFSTIRRGCANLIRLANSGRVKVSLNHDRVDHFNETLLQDLSERSFTSVSWSNIPDYHTFEDFHSICKTVSHRNCIHIGYSMNWMDQVMGASYADSPLASEEALLQMVSELKRLQEDFGLGHLLYANSANQFVHNGYSGVISKPYFGRWMREFTGNGAFCFQGDKGWVDYLNPPWDGLAQAMNRLTMAWTYDQDCASRKLPPLNT